MALMSRREMLLWLFIAVLALTLFLLADRADAHPDYLYPEDGVMTVELAKHRSAWLRLMELEELNGPYKEPATAKSAPISTRLAVHPLASAAIRTLVEAYFPAEWVDEALSVSWCESHWIPIARNGSSTASGLFQFLAATWRQYGVGDVLDPAANVKAAARLVADYERRGLWRWGAWTCQP